jgi:hypothetical protein
MSNERNSADWMLLLLIAGGGELAGVSLYLNGGSPV